MKVDQDVLEVLSRSTYRGPHILLLPMALERTLYLRVAKVLEIAGGKWKRADQGHVFEGDAEEAVEQIVLTGEIQDRKREFNQFWTPAWLGDRLVQMAQVQPGQRVLEPSAGRGNLVQAIQRAGANVMAFEIDPALAASVQPLCLGMSACIEADFLSISPPTPPTPRFDAVVMNPPFSNRREIHHVNHALGFLKPGGRLVSVMSSSVRHRTDALTSRFREMLEMHGGEIFEGPDGAFKEVGTMVRTVIVSLTAR